MKYQHTFLIFVSSDRSSYSDDGLRYIYPQQQRQLYQIFTQSINAIDVTSVTLSRLISINAIDVTRCWGYLGDILGISGGYLGDILGISWGVPPVIFQLGIAQPGAIVHYITTNVHLQA